MKKELSWKEPSRNKDPSFFKKNVVILGNFVAPGVSIPSAIKLSCPVSKQACLNTNIGQLNN